MFVLEKSNCHWICPGNEGAVRAMLEVPGINLNAKDLHGRTIVEVAKEFGNQGVEKLLVEKCESWQEWKDLDGKKNIQLHHCRVHQMWLKRPKAWEMEKKRL